jgi:hypothetical protein
MPENLQMHKAYFLNKLVHWRIKTFIKLLWNLSNVSFDLISEIYRRMAEKQAKSEGPLQTGGQSLHLDNRKNQQP